VNITKLTPACGNRGPHIHVDYRALQGGTGITSLLNQQTGISCLIKLVEDEFGDCRLALWPIAGSWRVQEWRTVRQHACRRTCLDRVGTDTILRKGRGIMRSTLRAEAVGSIQAIAG